MRIRAVILACLLGFADMVHAEDGMAHDHGGGLFHMLRLETDYGASRGKGIATWDFDGWLGGDDEKIWLKSEGAHREGKVEDAEFWAMYSRNVSMFWDVQAGVRYDVGAKGAAYFVAGVNGLAPYYFETKAHFFVSERGDVSLRLREENDFLLTQKLIVQPYAEINLFAQDVPSQNVGAGLSDAQLGMQMRYEFTRKFAPYLDVSYARRFGETASIANQHGEDRDAFITSAGLRLMF
jgi:copper resistance protein B